MGKGGCCQGHGYVHQDETTLCRDAKANSYCFDTLSWFYHKFHVLKKRIQKMKFSLKITTITYNVKRCLKESSCIFWISPNLVKYIYGWLPQHHKIENKIKYGF